MKNDVIMTPGMWHKFQFFQEAEFKCWHCGECHMNYLFIEELHQARVVSATPYIINSGYRCVEYDVEIGGSGNHTTGKAVDILIRNSRARYEILNGLFRVGFTRIGIGKDFIHVDGCEDTKVSEVTWLYD